MNARDKFKIGMRVRLTPEAVQLLGRFGKRKTGVVAGFKRNYPTCVMILRDGTRMPTIFTMDYWDIER